MSIPSAGPTAARWLTAARLIDVVRTQPGVTRASAAQELGIRSGAATELLARLRRVALLDESPAPAQGRGRPTTVLHAHPSGPLVIAVELSLTGWRVATADLDGVPRVVASTTRMGRDPMPVLAEMADVVGAILAHHGERIRAVSVSVAGAVRDDRLVQFTPLDWSDVDLSRLIAEPPADVELPILVGNDATLAGLAEARTGSARGDGTALHLIIAVGLGGALVVDGVPVIGAHGGAGEYGHVPFGDPTELCPCGAHGCWDLTVDGRALARHRGDPPPDNPLRYAYDLLDARRTATGPEIQRAFDLVGSSLGRGIAGLVNIHDPDVVTLGGLAAPLRTAAREPFDAAYLGGLMSFRKHRPPEVIDGIHGDDGPLHGAALRGVDHITTVDALAEWADR
ncbi:ROK family transcriptional regulator [Gordonia hankookensis]|uniref:ROK family protein n=1 Tax=Gordonia hankookensis TaxID=589403 RepID=A0ABR7WCN1_9ACTN|nr:ROK family transcriptional regulator [Gordonia hankookensis]MBD1320128.1 ROK family protein [Gordonia hankookensis]